MPCQSCKAGLPDALLPATSSVLQPAGRRPAESFQQGFLHMHVPSPAQHGSTAITACSEYTWRPASCIQHGTSCMQHPYHSPAIASSCCSVAGQFFRGTSAAVHLLASSLHCTQKEIAPPTATGAESGGSLAGQGSQVHESRSQGASRPQLRQARKACGSSGLHGSCPQLLLSTCGILHRCLKRACAHVCPCLS